MKNNILLSISLLLSQTLYSQNYCDNFYGIAGVGGSFSRCAKIKVDNRVWDKAKNGYSRRLGDSENYTVGLGYAVSPCFRFTAEGSFRPHFTYKNFQIATAGNQIAFAGNKTRHFSLNNKSLLFNFYMYGTKYTSLDLGYGFRLHPYIGTGVGVAYNKMNNFHSVLTDSVPSNGLTLHHVTSAMNPNTKRSLGWQFSAGLELMKACCFSLNLGYRYFNAGNFKSNDWIHSENLPKDISHATTVPAWKGKLRAHEIVFNLLFDTSF